MEDSDGQNVKLRFEKAVNREAVTVWGQGKERMSNGNKSYLFHGKTVKDSLFFFLRRKVLPLQNVIKTYFSFTEKETKAKSKEASCLTSCYKIITKKEVEPKPLIVVPITSCITK